LSRGIWYLGVPETIKLVDFSSLTLSKLSVRVENSRKDKKRFKDQTGMIPLFSALLAAIHAKTLCLFLGCI